MTAADSLACSLAVPATVVTLSDGQAGPGGIDAVDIQIISDAASPIPVGVTCIKANGTPVFVPWGRIAAIVSHGPRETQPVIT